MKARLTLILLFALFLAPIVVAVLLNSRWIDWEPAPERSHGELLDPVVALPAFELRTEGGDRLEAADLRDRWILVQVEPRGCDAACEERAYLMRQIRAGQNRHVPDIALLLVVAVAPEADVVERIRALDPTFRIVAGPGADELRQTFPGAADGGFYIVDPEGNIMERFGLGADPTGIRKDLRRLLTWTVRD
ncbi:hypothetical protein [Halomonas denitrificans]|nr:hypothetical protein [Halomonas denitrificans]